MVTTSRPWSSLANMRHVTCKYFKFVVSFFFSVLLLVLRFYDQLSCFKSTQELQSSVLFRYQTSFMMQIAQQNTRLKGKNIIFLCVFIDVYTSRSLCLWLALQILMMLFYGSMLLLQKDTREMWGTKQPYASSTRRWGRVWPHTMCNHESIIDTESTELSLTDCM